MENRWNQSNLDIQFSCRPRTFGNSENLVGVQLLKPRRLASIPADKFHQGDCRCSTALEDRIIPRVLPEASVVFPADQTAVYRNRGVRLDLPTIPDVLGSW